MKKLLLLGLGLCVFSLSAMTFKDYVATDYKSIGGKVKDADKCYSARYTDMYTFVTKANTDATTLTTLENKVKDFCTSNGKGGEKFNYAGKDRNALVFYKTKVTGNACTGKETDLKGVNWFFDLSECKDLGYKTN
ncbi:MAG: hypothetical protein WCQ47_08145 [bacterium]